MKSSQLCEMLNAYDGIDEDSETAHKYSSQSLLTPFNYFPEFRVNFFQF